MGNVTYHFHVGRYDEACELVLRHHYSRRVPSNVQVVGTMHESGGLFGDYGPAVAACFFGFSSNWRWGSTDTMELTRLVRSDQKVHLSQLVSLTSKVAKSSGAHLLISYADKEQGHFGGVYQACSWNYNGLTKPANHRLIDGIKYLKRSLSAKYGTASAKEIARITGKPVEIIYDEGKHLYWRALTREGKRKAERLGLTCLPYPKPQLALAAEWP